VTAIQGRHHALRLAYAMVGAPVVWGVQFVTLYALVDLGCGMQLDMGVIRTLVLVVTAIALLASLAAGWIASGVWHEAKNTTNDQATFMAIVGMALCMIFALALILTAVPVLIVSTCGEIAA
jgi:hypothetical protein